MKRWMKKLRGFLLAAMGEGIPEPAKKDKENMGEGSIQEGKSTGKRGK